MAPPVVALLPRRRPPGHLRGGGGVASPSPRRAPLAAARSWSFWTRVARIYGSYKAAQLHAALLRAQARPFSLHERPCASHRRSPLAPQGADAATVSARVWAPQHERAGKAMHELAVTLRYAHVNSLAVRCSAR